MIYRRMRNDMVARMRGRGWTWTKINTMLQGFGMKEVITHYRYEKNGIKLFFGEKKGRRSAHKAVD